MAKETGSSRVTEKGPVTRSSSSADALYKKVVLTPAKGTPPSLGVRTKSERIVTAATPSHLRRSERTRNLSSSTRSSGSNKHKSVNQSTSEERDGVETSSKVKRLDARAYFSGFTFKRSTKDFHAESNRRGTVTQEGGNGGGAHGGKTDEFFKGNSLDSKAVSKDGILPPEDSNAKDQSPKSRSSGPVKELLENNVTQGSLVSSDATCHETSGASERFQSGCHRDEASLTLASRSSMSNENLIRKCAGHDNNKNVIPSKRKRTMGDKDSDISATSVDDENCNLTADASPSRLCSNIVGTSELCSKRIRRISLSDVQRDQKKLINNVDHQPCSHSNGESLSTRNEEGNSGDSGERPRVNGVETENIRKKQKSLHLKLKPNIARLCEILLLPDKVKSMVENCLEYTMNNYQICTEPVSILQAFQLSLCWTASSLLNHEVDCEASLMLAKQHLNFDCDKDVVHEINSRMSDLKESFLSLTRNSKVSGSPKASESPSRNDSNTKVTAVELANRDISKNIEIQKHKSQWESLICTQRKEKQKLKKDIENEEADFQRRCRIELATIRSFSPNDVKRKEKLEAYHSGFEKRFGELKSQHETRLKDLEAKQLEARQKFQESLAPDDFLNLVGTPQNAPKALVSDHVAEGKNSENIVETMTSTGNGVGFSVSPETNSSVIVLCSSPNELQTPLVKHAGVTEMDSMASKDEPVFGNKCHNIAENEYEGEGNILSKLSSAREQCSDGAASRADEDEGCENFNRESHTDHCQDSVVTLVLLSSNGEICDGETSDVPGREVALAVHKSSCSNDDQVDVPSSKLGKSDGTVLSKTICNSSVNSDDFSDGVKNMVSLNSQSPEKHIQSANTLSVPNCKNAAQTHEPDDGHGSNNADTLNSPLSDERISSWTSKSSQEHVDSLNVTPGPDSEDSALVHKVDDSSGAHNVVPLNSLLIDDRSAHDIYDKEVCAGMPGTVNFTPTSMEQTHEGAVHDSVLGALLSRPCETAGPSNSPDANGIILSNQPFLEKQFPNRVPSGIPTGQNPVEVTESSHDQTTVSELDKEAAVTMLRTVNCADYPNNTTPLNSSFTDPISDEGLVLTENATLNSSSTNQTSAGVSKLDGVSSSRPCTSSPSNGHPAAISLLNPPSQQQVSDVSSTIPDGQISVIVPEYSQEEAEWELADSAMVDNSTTSDQQEGVPRIMIESTLSQATPVSRSVDLIEPREERQSLSSLESPHNQDTAKETQNSGVSNTVDILPVDQSNQTSLVMESPEQQLLSSNQDLPNLPLVTGIEDQATNALSSHIPEPSVEVQNQAVEQPMSNLEIDSHLRQVVHPASNLDTDSLMPGGVTTQSSNPRNVSTQGDTNNHPIPTAAVSASRVVPPIFHDPLYSELERLHKLATENTKMHEDMKLQCKFDYTKAYLELRNKYDIKFKEIEDEFQRTKKELDTQLRTVYVHRILAKTFKDSSVDHKVCDVSGMQQDTSFGQQLPQHPRQQHASSPYMIAPPSSCGPSAPSLSSHATPRSQNMLPTTPATYNTTGVFSGVSVRPPLINTISSASGSLQTGGEIRAPAPHLQPFRPSMPVPVPATPHLQPFRPSMPVPAPATPHLQPIRPSTSVPAPPPDLHPFRPSTSVPSASSFFTVPHMMPIHPAPGNIPLPSLSYSNMLPRQSTITEPGHRRGHWPESTGGLPARNFPAMNLCPDANSLSGHYLPNALPRLSGLATLGLSNYVTSSRMRANSPHQATSPDVVCLSDDD